MRILVTRPPPGDARTAARLRALGHAVERLPVAVIRPTGEPWPPAAFDAVALTSANGLAGCGPDWDAVALPVFAVGARTAAAARGRGLQDVREAGGDAAGLAARMTGDLPPGARVLYPTGRVRKPDLEVALAAAGLRVEAVETYDQQPVDAAQLGAALASLAHDGLRIDAVLHYSRAGAAAFVAGARASGHEAALLALPHGVLSADVAEPLRQAGATRLAVAQRPTEDALLDRLASLG